MAGTADGACRIVHKPERGAEGYHIEILASGIRLNAGDAHGVLYGHVAKANPQWRQAPTGEALVRMSLRELMARIDSADFIQVHRSVMVNSNAIVSATRDENGHYSLALRGLVQLMAPATENASAESNSEASTCWPCPLALAPM